jgi:lactoylglutathione lyase
MADLLPLSVRDMSICEPPRDTVAARRPAPVTSLQRFVHSLAARDCACAARRSVLRVARAIGINHVALDVGDLEQALAFWRALIPDLRLRGRGDRMAFIDLGDQFIALFEQHVEPRREHRHFGLVVDDVDAVREAVRREGLDVLGGRGSSFDFRDPWGNRFQVVGYRNIQFERTEGVRRALGIEELEKTADARREIAERGLA